MTVATIQGLKGQLAFTPDIGGTDDSTLQQLLDAAQSYVETYIGKEIEAVFGGVGQDPIPAALVQAIYQLAAHWWEIRGQTEVVEMMKAAPVWVQAIINEFRTWTF